MYGKTQQFYHLWRLAVQERDEAREQLIHSLAELSNYDLFFGDSPSNFSVNSSPLELSVLSNQMRSVEKMRDYETVVLEMIGGVLPENGKFLQAVSEAGSLVESLFIAGPVPKWINPPVQLSSQRPVLNNDITGYGNWNYGGLEFC
ncbi:Uncharacterized protein HA466_0000770 [Hirschfeldia incana]|nr:Uncharacterized protein HA466_0000770 [Hirschfeldia incana]